MKNVCTILHFHLNYHVQRAGEGRRPWATTISTSGPQISFFLFRQPWATTISPSVPPFLTLPGKNTFLNAILRAFKVWSSKILKLDEPFRDHEIFNLIFSTIKIGFSEQKIFVCIFCCCLYFAPWIRIRGSSYFCGSGSRSPHIFADPDQGEAKMLRIQILILRTALRMRITRRRKQYSSHTNPISSIFSLVWRKVIISMLSTNFFPERIFRCNSYPCVSLPYLNLQTSYKIVVVDSSGISSSLIRFD